MPDESPDLNAAIRVTPNVSWAIENSGIRVFDLDTRSVTLLDYPGAAIWDCVARGRTHLHTVRLLCGLYPVDEADAGRIILRFLEGWLSAGLVTRVSDHG